ncbi:MAG: hypothetical protein ACYS3N_15205 [Planctomycetota bacterium]|jgi:hypothetical protein
MMENIQVAQEVCLETTQCPSNFACINNGQCPKCAVQQYAYLKTGVGCIVKPEPDTECPYLMKFVDLWVCKCPTRLEIFNKYHR